MIPADLSERNYTYDNWKTMVLGMTRIRALAEAGGARPGEEAAKEILKAVEKIEKEVGFKFA